jgi:hypothetical protein
MSVSFLSQSKTISECKILKTSWSDQDEIGYQRFVTAIGMAVEQRRCNTVDRCMKSDANPFRRSDPRGIVFDNDCGKLSPLLRSYYACKMGLPISLVNQVVPRDVAGNRNRPIRYNPFGNKVSSRKDYTTSFSGRAPLLTEVIYGGVQSYFTAFYRILESESDDAPMFADFYSPKIAKDSILPGTTIYDPNGHVVTVYKIEDDGRILYIDSHPDSSLTRGTFGTHISRSHPGQGWGFKNWRPLKLIGAEKGPQGNYLGGQITTVPNYEIANYSNEQYYGNQRTDLREDNWKSGAFVLNGERMDFYAFTRASLSKGDLKLNPFIEVQNKTKELCEALKDRVEAVDVALLAGIQLKEHPPRLPDNIYGTDGEWEIYSTPSRDARLKTQFIDLLDASKKIIEMYRRQDPKVVYQGTNIAGDMYQAYDSAARACVIQYENSVGGRVSLNLEEVRQRLFKISFDPYHCAELRWGAEGDELASCPDNSIKRLWYIREETLRNQHERKYDIIMGFSLNDLATFGPGKGSLTPAETDLLGYLSSNP